ncbi:MAG: hypothetical protein AB8G18_17245 [Gammaproteobacteria bacterium]
MITALILSAIMIGAAKLLLKGDVGVDFWNVFSLVFVSNIIFFIAVSIIDANGWGLVPLLAALFGTGLIVLFTSNMMYEWGLKKSTVFAAVFVFSYILVDIGFGILAGA